MNKLVRHDKKFLLQVAEYEKNDELNFPLKMDVSELEKLFIEFLEKIDLKCRNVSIVVTSVRKLDEKIAF